MSEKKKFYIFLLAAMTLIVLVCLNNFTMYFALKDYQVYTFTSCDPESYSCFVTDPQFTGFSFYSTPYVKVEMDATNAPPCLDEHNCENFSCEGKGSSCTITYCSENLLEEGEICTESQL